MLLLFLPPCLSLSSCKLDEVKNPIRLVADVPKVSIFANILYLDVSIVCDLIAARRRQ